MNELLLKIIGEIVLGSKEDYATFRDYRRWQYVSYVESFAFVPAVLFLLLTRNGEVSKELIGSRGMHQVVDNVYIEEFAAKSWCSIFICKLG